jgi:predicted nucleic acid-binding protein
MEHRKALIDTSIIIDHLRKRDKQKTMLFNIADRFDLFVSSITVFELFAGATDERKKNDIENIIGIAEVIFFSTDIAKEAGELYISLKKENRIFEIRDIFIAATAATFNLPIVTLNRKHFERIKKIKLLSEEGL